MKIAYLGPAGTFTEDALREAAEAGFEPLRTATVHDAILAVERGEADRALVPFENSIEGSVRSTLDALAFEAPEVTIVGEYDYAVRANLIARPGVRLEEVTAVLSHPQPLAQCARFLRERMPAAEARASAAPPRRCGRSASRPSPGRRSAPGRRPSSMAARSSPRGSRTRRQT